MSKPEKNSDLLLKCRITPKGHLSCRIVDQSPETKVEEPPTVPVPDPEPCPDCTPDESGEDFCVLPERNNNLEPEPVPED